MKKLFAALLLLLPVTTVQAQPSLWWGSNNISTNTRGGTIQKGDTIALEVKINPAGTNIRSVYFDFQHQKDAIQFLGVSSGPAIPTGASFNTQNYLYPNCKFNRNSNNTTNNGWNNYVSANYTCNSQTVPYAAIDRILVNVATNQMLLQATYVTLKFQVTNTTAGFPYDSVYMNFGFGYDNAGNTMQNTQNVGAKGVWIQLDPTANNLLTGAVAQSANTSAGLQTAMKLSVTDTSAQPNEVTNALLSAGGKYSFAQQIQNNTNYRMRLMVPADSLVALSTAATTVSDYTMALQEFITQNLDGTYKNNNMTNGIMFWAADVNNDGKFDGADVQKLFDAVVGLDTILKPVAGCGSGCYMGLPVLLASTYDTVSTKSWTSLMSSYVPVKTTQTSQTVNMKYMLKGDVNLSHSSVVGAAMSAAMSAAMGSSKYIPSYVANGNLVVAGAKSIDVSVANAIVTSNNVSVPFNVNTNGVSLSGLQFEVKYDTTKVKFDSLQVNTPSWISFVNNANAGVIRFGALDKDLKNPLTGTNLIPFKLHFVSVGAGADLSTSVQIYPTMDAADSKGNQVGINFNTTAIKLIGANFFTKP